MIWLLTLFRSIALAMKRAGVLTGDTAEDRRVFLRTVAALGGSSALGQLVGVEVEMDPWARPRLPPILSHVPSAFREIMREGVFEKAARGAAQGLVSFSFDGLFTREFAVELQETQEER